MGKDVIVACDFPGREPVLEFLDRFTGRKPFVKIGMELFYGEGPQIVREIKARGHKIFLDLKLHDIPNTVKKAMRVLSELDVDLYVLGSTQEETHSTGAITAAFGVMPHLCVAVDVTHGDSPDASKDKTFPLGGGPVIGVGPNCTRWMSKRLEEKAGELEMDCQIEVMAGHSGTNGWDLQISREGVATAVLSLPLRYMHTPVETASRADMTACARLLAAFIRGIGKEVPSYD